MKTGRIGGNIAVIVVIGVLGLSRFSENVRLVQVVGLFASGVAVGVSLGAIISTIRGKKKPDVHVS